MNEEKQLNFEQSFARLEEILDRLNSGKVTLDESLKLYEEADLLINSCNSLLNGVEKRIESLIKKRGGEVQMDNDENPLVEPFQTQEVGFKT